ncbi:hypothetical protein D3C75_851050 [compost metagenome]
MLPAVLALFFITLAIHRQLLQQQATGLAAFGVEPEARVELLRLDEVVGEALRQGGAVEVDGALVALALDRIDGQGQVAVGHQLRQGRIRRDLVRFVAGHATDVPVTGTFDHQQRDRPCGTRLQNQQAVELQRPHQQGGGGHQLAQQCLHRLRVLMTRQHRGVAVIERHPLAAHIALVEDETLGEIGIRQVAHRFWLSENDDKMVTRVVGKHPRTP